MVDMNFLSIVAFIMAGSVLAFGVLSSGRWEVFFDAHAILIVVGGSIAASSISFQIDHIISLFRVFFKRVIIGRKENYVSLIKELMSLAEAYRMKSPNLEKLVNDSDDFFLKEAMIAVMDGAFEEEVLIRILRIRMTTIFHFQFEEALKFKAIGKYPPAFGLMGTTISMISLLQSLGESGAQSKIGPAMALGLVATFYGVSLSNLVFSPIAENLLDSSKENKRKNTIIVEGIRLILKKSNSILLAEELNSYLLPGQRLDWKNVSQEGQKAA